MFTKNSKAPRRSTASRAAGDPPVSARRGRGRPRGATQQGAETKDQLFRTALELIAARGYEATTLRDIAQQAGVSVGLLYRYFPSKRAVVLALYDELSAKYSARAAALEPGPWRERFLFALETSLSVLGEQRQTLATLTPVLVGNQEDGLFAPSTQFSRQRVQAVFEEVVLGARDAPDPEPARALGRLLYVVHLAVILWWLLDKSPGQRATTGLVAVLARSLPIAALTLRLAPSKALVHRLDRLCRAGLFGENLA